MKKKLILPALLLCAGMSLQAQQQQASAFYLRPAVSLRAPLQGDSINFTGDMDEQFMQTLSSGKLPDD